MRTQAFPYHMMNCHLPVTSEHDVRAVIAAWQLHIGRGFHPDTQGADYQDGDERRTFTDSQAHIYDVSIRQCHEKCDHVYAVCSEIYRAIYGGA